MPIVRYLVEKAAAVVAFGKKACPHIVPLVAATLLAVQDCSAAGTLPRVDPAQIDLSQPVTVVFEWQTLQRPQNAERVTASLVKRGYVVELESTIGAEARLIQHVLLARRTRVTTQAELEALQRELAPLVPRADTVKWSISQTR